MKEVFNFRINESKLDNLEKIERQLNKAVERINTVREHLTDKEVMWVMSLLTFEKLLDLVKDSDEFNSHVKEMKARTIQ